MCVINEVTEGSERETANVFNTIKHRWTYWLAHNCASEPWGYSTLNINQSFRLNSCRPSAWGCQGPDGHLWAYGAKNTTANHGLMEMWRGSKPVLPSLHPSPPKRHRSNPRIISWRSGCNHSWQLSPCRQQGSCFLIGWKGSLSLTDCPSVHQSSPRRWETLWPFSLADTHREKDRQCEREKDRDP